MKPRIVILISLLALLVLLCIQYYSISQVYRLKGNEFDLRYGRLIQQSLYNLEYQQGGSGLDSVFYYLEIAAFRFLEDLQNLEMNANEDELFPQIISEFQSTIISYETLTSFIREYLAEQGADPEFRSGMVIRQLEILDYPDEYPVYDESMNALKELINWDPGEFNNALQVNSYRAEGNYYRISFDFYIDFTHKKRIIFREMAGIFTLSVITIIIVLFIFTYTIRNMIRQKQLSDMKTDFINNMTHELKTPLTTIAVASSSLVDPAVHSSESRIIDISRMIGKQNRHLNQLIDHILDVELWERDQVILTRQPIGISRFLKEKIEAFRIEHKDDNVVIVEDFDLEGLQISLDEFQFTRVMNNLLSNAVKYNSGNPEITVKAYTTDKLFVCIKDNGIGIDREAQKHIFTKFFRANKGDIQRVKGLGLGLYYVKKIVEAHGGEITVESKPGKGSTFIVRLPI